MRISNAEKNYITWLVNKMNIVEDRNYSMLLRELYRREFYSVIKYDEDRGSDGIALRNTWADEIGYTGDTLFGPPRVLETLMGISMRIEDQIFVGPWFEEWDYKRIFWDLINNLGLINFDGILNNSDYKEIDTVLDEFLSKTSRRDTFSNIFHFYVTPHNIKKMNLWEQMHAYIAEKWPGKTYL
jgi:hypothetical protein